jgi:hypothetical protein
MYNFRKMSNRRAALGFALLVALAISGLSVWGGVLPAEWMYTRWVPPDPPPPARETLLDEERRAIATLSAQIRGRLLWSSNRLGNHDLFVVDLESGAERRLTDHPHVEFFSRFSPDGRRVSFLRSRRSWVSFRETEAWDLYVVNADGSDERRLAERAYHPTWLPDGSGLMFVSDNRIVTVDLRSGAQRVLHEGGDPPTSGEVQEPEPIHGGRIALTLRGVQKETVGVLDPATRTYRPVSTVRACQIAGVPGRNEVVWIESGGRGDKQVMHADLTAADLERRVLIDLPGSYSHEYFPRVTADGKWLVWGASAEGHEHDRADYEIFAWKLGTPWTTALRLTYSPANDQWPDLLVMP